MARSTMTGMDAFSTNVQFLTQMANGGIEEIAVGTMLSIADKMAARAQELAPVKTGHLRAGITVEEGENECWIHSEASYSLFPEFGTVHHAAQPFFRPAFHEFRFFAGVGQAVQDAIYKNLAV